MDKKTYERNKVIFLSALALFVLALVSLLINVMSKSFVKISVTEIMYLVVIGISLLLMLLIAIIFLKNKRK